MISVPTLSVQYINTTKLRAFLVSGFRLVVDEVAAADGRYERR